VRSERDSAPLLRLSSWISALMPGVSPSAVATPGVEDAAGGWRRAAGAAGGCAGAAALGAAAGAGGASFV